MRKFKMLFSAGVFLLLVVFFVACTKSDDGGDQNILEAKIVLSSATGAPGDTITIDGESSVAPEGATFNFNLSGVEGTDYTIYPQDNPKKLVVGFLKTSNYTISLRIENQGSFDQSETLSVTISGAKKIGSDISTQTTLGNLSNSSADYRVDKIIEISANLTLMADVSIEFSAGAGFLVTNGATINLSTNNSFVYTGTATTEGWKGIYLLSGSINLPTGQLSVYNGGYGAWDNGESGAIIIDSTSRISTDPYNSILVFDKSGSYNVNVLKESGRLDPGRVTSVDGKGIKCFPYQLSNSTYIGASVEVKAGAASLYGQSLTGEELILLGDVEFTNLNSIQIKTVKVSEGKAILFNGGNSSGIYITNTDFVGFNGASWKGIYFQSSAMGLLQFSGVKVKNAGWREGGSSEISAAITSSTGIISYVGGEIENQYGYGIYSFVGVNNVNNVLFNNCKTAGAAINYRGLLSVADNNVFTLDAGVPGIELIDGYSSNTVGYYQFNKLVGSFYGVKSNLTLQHPTIISPGARFVVDPGLSIYLGQNFSAIGTETDSIIFEGKNRTIGYWNGIAVDAGSMQMKYLRVSDAGSGYLSRGQGSAIFSLQKANMVFFGNYLMNNSQNYLQNSVFSNSGGYGVFIVGSNNGIDEAYVNANGNSFSNNTSGNVLKQ